MHEQDGQSVSSLSRCEESEGLGQGAPASPFCDHEHGQQVYQILALPVAHWPVAEAHSSYHAVGAGTGGGGGCGCLEVD